MAQTSPIDTEFGKLLSRLPDGLDLEASARAQVSAIADLSDVALLNRLRRAADWLGEIVAAILSERMADAVSAGAERRVRLVDATTLSCPGSRKTDWRVHVGFRLGPRPRIEQLALSDGRGAESLGRFVCGPGDIVIDCFMGSGTTLLAAEKLGRRCRGIEISPGFVDVAIRRWEKATGGAAVLEETGHGFEQTSGERRS